MVRPETKTSEEVDGAKEIPLGEAMVIAVTVAETRQLQNMHLKEKWKTVRVPNYQTKTRHRPTQFKKIIYTLPVLCVEKDFRGLNEVLPTCIDLVETNFMLTYPAANQ